MKIIPGSRRRHYIARVSVFLVTLALIAGMVGCDGECGILTITSTAGGSVTVPGEGIHNYYCGTVVDLVDR
jgi:hypothetical protein